MFLKLLLLSFCLLHSCILAESMPVDPLVNPLHFDQQQIQARGFLYRMEDGELVLSTQPGLKSCCIGREELRQQQIFVYSNQPLEPGQRVVTLNGLFRVLPQRYVLEQAVLVAEKPTSWWWLVGIVLGPALYYYLGLVSGSK